LVKIPLLHSFEKLIRGMDSGAQAEQLAAHDTLQRRPKRPATSLAVVEDGVCLGRP
jgi:hypothetical protein